MTYTAMRFFLGGDRVSCEAIIASIEKRWASADQEPFIASILLNPLLKTTPFRPDPSFSLASIHQLLRSLFTRFFPEEHTTGLFNLLSDYLAGKGEFSAMEQIISEVRKVPEVRLFCELHLMYSPLTGQHYQSSSCNLEGNDNTRHHPFPPHPSCTSYLLHLCQFCLLRTTFQSIWQHPDTEEEPHDQQHTSNDR